MTFAFFTLVSYITDSEYMNFILQFCNMLTIHLFYNCLMHFVYML